MLCLQGITGTFSFWTPRAPFSEMRCQQQPNSYDCGIWLIANAEYIAQQIVLPKQQFEAFRYYPATQQWRLKDWRAKWTEKLANFARCARYWEILRHLTRTTSVAAITKNISEIEVKRKKVEVQASGRPSQTSEKRIEYAREHSNFVYTGYIQIRGFYSQNDVEVDVKQRRLKTGSSHGHSCLCCSIMFHLALHVRPNK